MSYVEMKSERLPEKLAELIDNQSELSRKTGIGQSAISAMVSGKRRPYFDQMAAIARELGVPLEYLADDTLDTPPVSEISEDERYLVQLCRDMGLDRATAVQRLTQPVGAKPLAPTYGDMKDRRGKARRNNTGA